DFIGDVALAGANAVRVPVSINWGDVPRLVERAGADSLPIVLVINFLVGLVTAFQAAVQLRQFGANIFVADLVGLSVTRELAPLMTAIIVAGRSGAAFSAELGTMRVSEEIDALRTLGLDPYGFLVFPRVIALALVLPLLTILADVVSIAGGLLVAMLGLDLTANAYLLQTQKAVGLWDVFSGCLKTVFFGLSVALIACQRGLAARGGAEGVGRATTSAAVVPMIEIEDLTVGYGDTVVLEDLDFTVPRGDVFAILGGSGSGKSTLLRALIGLEEPMRGTVRIAGAPPAREGPPRYGVLFQSGALFGSMTLAENVALPLAKWTSLDRDAIDTIVRSKLRLVGLEGFENHLPAAISGGMKKRAGIARALALDPPLLFLDE